MVRPHCSLDLEKAERFVDAIKSRKHNKKKAELEKIFINHGINPNEKLAFSCGSGITACVLGLASAVINNKLPVIYDGSWAEYGLK